MNPRPIAAGARLATVTVARSGLVTLSAITCEFLGWPSAVATAAVGGGLLISAATPAMTGAGPVSYNSGNSARASNGRTRCHAAVKAAGLLPAVTSARYLALACETEDGRAAVLVRPVDSVGVMYSRTRVSDRPRLQYDHA